MLRTCFLWVTVHIGKVELLLITDVRGWLEVNGQFHSHFDPSIFGSEIEPTPTTTHVNLPKKKLNESDLMEPLTGTGAPVEKS